MRLNGFGACAVVLAGAVGVMEAQQQTPPPENPATQSNLPNAPSSVVTGKPAQDAHVPLEDLPHPVVEAKQVPLNLAADEFRIVTSPLYFRTRDLYWAVPLAGAAAVAFDQDTHVSRDVVSHDAGFANTAGNLSNAGVGVFIGLPVALYGVGLVKHDERAHETGVLASEAMTVAFATDALVKLGSFRERPSANNSRGDFFQTGAGFDSSFVSAHAMVSWSSAAVLAAEYPKPWQQVLIYAGATSVSVNRVLGEYHFPSDVLIGSAAGWLIGHYVVRAHHHVPIYRHHRTVAAAG